MEAKRQQRTGMKEIAVFYSDSQTKVYITSKESEKDVQEIKKIIIKQLKYSARIHLYEKPVIPFHKLDFLNPALSFEEVLSFYPSLSFTYNNTQYIEQLDFYDQLGAKPNQIVVILQICQRNGFNHERYRIDSKANINFIVSLAKRYGRNVYLQYYELRLPLNRFGKDELLVATLGKFCFGSNMILITVDSQDYNHLYKEVFHQDLINSHRYYLISLPNGEGKIVMNRQAEWKIIAQMLPIVLEAQLYASSNLQVAFQPLKLFEPSPTINKIYLHKNSQTKYSLEQPIKSAILIGQTDGMILILQKSNILHIYSDSLPFQMINKIVLTGNQSLYIDDQIPLIKGSNLMMYSITRKQICLKQYSLPMGDLMTIKSIDWNGQQYGSIQCQSLDILAVPIKKTMLVRTFYVDQPNNYYDVKVLKSNWKIWIAKNGCNNFSDGSGLFAISQQYIDDIDVYDLKKKQHIAKIVCKFEVEFIRFHEKTERILVSYEGMKVIEYLMKDKKAEVLLQIEKKNRKEDLYYSQKGEIFHLSTNTLCWYNSQQEIRFNKSLLYSNGTIFSKDQSLQMHEIQNIFIIQENNNLSRQQMKHQIRTDHST